MSNVQFTMNKYKKTSLSFGGRLLYIVNCWFGIEHFKKKIYKRNRSVNSLYQLTEMDKQFLYLVSARKP